LKLKFPPGPIVQFIRRFWKTLLLITLVSLATLILSAAISIWLSSSHNLHLPSLGTIQVIGVEAYGGDISTMQDGEQFIDWGTVYPGSLTNRSFYVKSISNEPITLQLNISNLTFQNSEGNNVTEPLPVKNPLILTWNYSGVLNPKEQIFVVLTLEISPDPRFIDFIIDNDVKRFYFDIAIKPVEQ
jgi:hypothetical protein